MSSVLKNLSFTSSGCSGCASYKNYSSQHFFRIFSRLSIKHPVGTSRKRCAGYVTETNGVDLPLGMSWDGRWCGGSERLAGPGLFWGVPLHFAFILPLSRLVFSLRFTTFLVSWRVWLVRGHLASLPQRFPESLLAVGAACDPACTKKGARATQVGGCASRCGEREKYATAPAACSCTHSAQPEHLVRGNMSRGGI